MVPHVQTQVGIGSRRYSICVLETARGHFSELDRVTRGSAPEMLLALGHSPRVVLSATTHHRSSFRPCRTQATFVIEIITVFETNAWQVWLIDHITSRYLSRE